MNQEGYVRHPLPELTREISTKIILFSAIAFSASSFFFSVTEAFENKGVSLPIYILTFIFISAALFSAAKIKSINNEHVLLTLALAFISRAIWSVIFPTEQTSDFSVLLNSAISASNGDFRFTEKNYFQNWAYQLGFVAYQAIVLFLTNESISALKLINCAYIAGSCYALFKISEKLFGRNSAYISLLAYALYLPTLYSSALLTNQHLSTFLFLTSAYIFIRYPTILGAILSSAIASLGDVIRPLAPVYLLAIAIYIVFLAFGESDSKIAIKKFLFIPVYFIAFFATSLLVTASINASGMYDGKLSNNNPYWKFVTGLNHESGGGYSRKDNTIISKIGDTQERDEYQKELIYERISDAPALFSLFGEKYVKMWSVTDSIIFWSFRETDFTGLKITAESAMAAQYSLYLLLFFSALFRIRERNATAFIISIIIIYVGVHFLIEIQTRYRYFAMPFIVVFAGHGVSNLLSVYSKLRNTSS